MRFGSAIITAFLSTNVIFGGDQRPGAPFDYQQQRQKEQKEQKKKDAPAQKKQGDDEATIRVDTTLVTVPVIAMDRSGKFVPGLKAEDFRVFEEGVAQEIAFFLSAEEPVTVALMLDVSDSTRSNLEEIKAAAIAFVDQLRPDDQVTVIAFDGGLRELTLATSDRRAIHDAIRNARTGGGTRLYDALDFVLTKRLNRINGRKAVILFTDGVDVDSHISMEKSMRTVEEAGVFIYPIQYKHPPDSSSAMLTGRLPIGGESYRGDPNKAAFYLQGIAKSTGANFYLAEDKKSMTKSFASIAEELRKRYDLGYYPTAPAKPGQTVRIKVMVERRGVVVRARASYVYSPSGAEK